MFLRRNRTHMQSEAVATQSRRVSVFKDVREPVRRNPSAVVLYDNFQESGLGIAYTNPDRGALYGRFDECLLSIGQEVYQNLHQLVPIAVRIRCRRILSCNTYCILAKWRGAQRYCLVHQNRELRFLKDI